ncbi:MULTISPECIES: glycosyltransferase family 39 protein [unclassified Coleofasciculus]|uniref:glycosyltransferase family 39 protein n=1 Tax=unclassified Coleofasciculus TaxID=2692782 RepID=UPI001881BDC3|nr:MULTISPECIES: glycosyltransferase family 39 protein [unclassified Coleofasciculus]MBE9124682.1 glycosyltransferase family 39 protein [Coleofasciculus sp. LEGE 07081]MBE9147009.1 glycosyltransferase family 39 protein [Coleofasciculus sp. LEGE 07092]
MSRSFPISKLSLRFSSVLLIVIAIAVLLRVVNLSRREFWYDEVLSLLLITGQKTAYETPQDTPVVLANYTPLLSLPLEKGIDDILDTVQNMLRGLAGEPHPPLFFLSQHLWLRLFGNGQAAMRGLGALLSIGTIGSAFGLGRRLLGYRGGLLLAALLGTNAYYLFHSLNVRMYGLLVLWVILSAWALLELIDAPKLGLKEAEVPSKMTRLLWSLIFIGSVAAGLLTFYYYAYFLLALVILVLWLDRQRWWQHGLRFGAGVLLTVPWVLWGTRQQLRNADFERFGASDSLIETALKHVEGVTQTLGIHLVVGDWVSRLPPVSVTVAGIAAIALLVACSINLWRQNRRQILGIALLLGIFPLLVALTLDVVKGQFTVGFGWGRSMIFILPGCLLLIAACLERATSVWRPTAAAVLLLLYLSISVADFSTRPRWMFHRVAAILQQEPTTPTLIAISSNAWGHVLRLAYYIPPQLPIMLLAQKSAQLAPALEKTLASEPTQYQRILWLDSARPVWGSAATPSEREQVRQILEPQFQLEAKQQLSGTMELDQFTAYLYKRSASTP